MKKWIFLLGMSLSISLFAACGKPKESVENSSVDTVESGNQENIDSESTEGSLADNTDDMSISAENVMICRVIDNENGMLLLAEKDKDAGSVYRVGTDGGGLTGADGQEIPTDEIKKGSMLEIAFDGGIKETFPARIGNIRQIRLLEDEFDDLCSLYLDVLEDIWDADGALNGDIVMAGMDLSSTSLSSSERAAVAWRFGELHGVEVIEGSFEELAEWGYINKEELYWKDGCLFSITEKGMEEKNGRRTVTFDAEKWRSGLGAYYFLDCSCTQDENGSFSEYEKGAEAIA